MMRWNGMTTNAVRCDAVRGSGGDEHVGFSADR